MAENPTRAEYEEQFRRAGLPLLIESRDASRDIWTRAVGLLALIFWVELLGALDLTWPWWGNVLALVGGLALLASAWAGSNRLRGRPPFARPDDVGVPELAGFVIIPALLPLIFNQQPISALVTLFGNLAILGLIYAVTALGLVSIIRWAGRRLFGQLAGSLALVARALPLLMLFSVVLFMTNEMWQAFANMNAANLITVGTLLVLVGTLFLFARLPREVDRLLDDSNDLTRSQRFNVGLVLFVSQALQVVLVTIAVGLFFAVFGTIVVDGELAKTWAGGTPDMIGSTTILGVQLSLSDQTLVVAAAVAALSGLYYAIAVFTDSTYREEFLGEVTGEMRATFAARDAYLAVIREEPQGA